MIDAMQEFDVIPVVADLFSSAIKASGPAVLPQLSEEQWDYVLGVCAAQNIHTFVFDVLPQDVPEPVFSKWKSLADSAAARNRCISALASVQEQGWRKMGIRYLLMKGPALAGLYPVPEHRGCGDIDWCFSDEDGWVKARQVAERNADGGLHCDSDGDFNYSFKGFVIEHHRDWTHLSSGRLRRIAGAPSVIDGRLSPEDTLLMLECHILHHLAFSGIGLKQFADLALALLRYDGLYDKSAFYAKVEALGLTRWVGLMHAVLVELADIPAAVFPVASSGSRKELERMIGIIFSDGCVSDGKKLSARNLFIRAGLFLRMAPRESVARYFHLVRGRISRFHK